MLARLRSQEEQCQKAATSAQLEKLCNRPVPKELLTPVIDAKRPRGDCAVVALGVDLEGKKHVPGLWPHALDSHGDRRSQNIAQGGGRTLWQARFHSTVSSAQASQCAGTFQRGAPAARGLATAVRPGPKTIQRKPWPNCAQGGALARNDQSRAGAELAAFAKYAVVVTFRTF